MIRLATVFSGIGAIEHALDRMQLEHEIVFACDNGDVDILTKEIGMNVDDIGAELSELKRSISVIHDNGEVQDLYKDQLFGMLNEANSEYAAIVDAIKAQEDAPATLTDVISTILSSKSVKPARLKEYKSFMGELGTGSLEQQLLKKWQVILEIANDFKKDNSLEDLGKDLSFKSSDGIDWTPVSAGLKELYDYLEACNGIKISAGTEKIYAERLV